MTESIDQSVADDIDSTGEFFSVGGPLHAVRAGYVRRQADDLLYQTLIAGNFAHLIAPDRTGKSSLIASTSARLQNNGVKVAVLDLEQIADRDGGADAGRWYYSIVYRLLRQLRLKVDLQAWWQDKAILSYRQRLVEFYVEIVLQNVTEPIVIFVDQVQCVAVLPFAENLLASIRAAHNARSTDPEFTRLTFCLVGECDPHALVDDPELSPFGVSREILLGDFSCADLALFATELNLSPDDSRAALDRIFDWTGGQPYLTQKLARSVARELISGDINAHVDRIAIQQLAGRAALHSEPHMSHIHRSITANTKVRDGMLTIYGKLAKGMEVRYDPDSRVQASLFASGLVARNSDATLKVKNRVYASVFTARWANENLPIHWRGPAIAAVVMLLIAAIPFLYTQILPRPYVDRMFDATEPMERVAAAYYSLHSFPGHAVAADRLYRVVLQDRATSAADLATISQIDAHARALDPTGALADGLLAAFWDRQVGLALRIERRDAAVIAALESLVEPTPNRRRRAATLVGDDYPQLVGTIPGHLTERLEFDPVDVSMTFVDSATITQWTLSEGELLPKEAWTISALEVTPLVRRVVVDRIGRVSRIGLSINVSHARLSDLLIKLIAPSGRAVDLQFSQAASSANEFIAIDRGELESLQGELLSGTWSLSVRDEATGIDGHLVGWNLSLNSQVIVENFDRGLDIPDPLEKESDNLWVADDGRFAVARLSQSDGMQLWDLRGARPIRTLAVPASEVVIGFSPQSGYLVTATADSINLWRTGDGRRQTTLATGASSQQAVMSNDGRRLLVESRGETNTDFELWSLETHKRITRISVAGTPALVSIDASGSHLAVADYDRSVRVWDFSRNRLLAQFDLAAQPTRIELSPDGSRLGAVHGDRGVSLWHADVPDAPLLQEWQVAPWQMAFSATGRKFLAGNPRYGFQVYRSQDGSIMGPLLGSGMSVNATSELAFSMDERFILTGTAAGISRLWRAPMIAPSLPVDAAAENPSPHQLWRESGNSVSTISPGGERMAIGDADGHVHFLRVGADDEELAAATDELNFLGHQAPVVAISFSHDSSVLASAATNGSIRVWDAQSGIPKPYSVLSMVNGTDQLQFSPDGTSLAVNSGRRVSIVEVGSGSILAAIELGEMHTAMAFAGNEVLYLGAESGTLRVLAADRSGSWNLRNVWQGTSAIRQMAISLRRQQLLLVNALNEARSLDIRSGRVSPQPLTMPDVISDIVFSADESRALLRTPRWVHRTTLAPGGLMWRDAIRAPKALAGSRMVLDQAAAYSDSAGADNDRVLVLTRETGFAEVAELEFNHSTGPALIGNREDLLAEWREKLAIPAEDPRSDTKEPVVRLSPD
jgi:WD40 repeat protein